MRSPDRRPRAVHLVLRCRPVPRHRALSRAPRDVQATVSPSTVPELLEEAARAERNEIERQKKDAYDRWVLKGVLVTQPDDTTCVVTVCAPDKDAPRAWEEAVGKRAGGADNAPEAPTRASARGHTVTIVQETFERRLEPRRGRGDARRRDPRRRWNAARTRGGDSARTATRGTTWDGGNGRGRFGFVSRPSVVFRQHSLRSWTSDRSGSSEASGSGTRRGNESD